MNEPLKQSISGRMRPMKCGGVIFDLDGTLADTLSDLTDAINAGLASFALAEHPIDKVREWIGDGLPVLCRRAMGDASDVPIDELVMAVRTHYQANSLNKTKPYPRIPDLLDALAQRRIPMAVLTNKPQVSTVPIVDALFHQWQFVAVEGYTQEALKKPDPRTAVQITMKMRLRPSEVIILGDSPTDIATAHNAGCTSVAACWGYRDRQPLIDAAPNYLIDFPDQILQLI